MNNDPSLRSNHIMVELDQARKIYPMGAQEVRALDGVSISFREGSFWAIMGPSGSGKSTMMNIIGCLDRLTDGRYLLEGHDVKTLDDDSLSEFRLKHLGFIFQSFNLIPQLTVQRNIELPLYYLGWEAKESEERAIELARRVGLEERLDHRPTELSGGQMQRVAIARAIVTDPTVLLADEPTGNLDATSEEEILILLKRLNEEFGKSMIMVTHDPRAAGYASRVLHLDKGNLSEN